MKKNMVLAIVLSMGVILSWDLLVMKPQRQTRTPQSVASRPAEIASPSGSSVPADAVPQGAPERKRLVEYTVGINRLTFNMNGAAVDQWAVEEKGRWTPLVKEFFPERPLTTFSELTFEPYRQSAREFVFTAKRADGLSVRKTFNISPDGHIHTITLELTNLSGAALEVPYSLGWGPGITSGDADPKEDKASQRALAVEGPRLHKFKPGVHEDDYLWWAADARYFLAGFLNDSGRAAKLAVEKKDGYYSIRKESLATLAPGQKTEESYRLYVGPKGYAQLESLGLGLERAVDFGIFGGLGKIVLKSLYWLHNLTGNYGWAIFILTVAIQLLVIPLTIKSFRHGLKMKALQPQMKKLQELYKSDPKRLNAEMLHLYQKNGMKFMGMEGCFPILIQLPVFWALYTTLRNAYELRDAAWILWIHDLSVHDPYYVLPILMGLGMLAQQKMTMTAMDPTQAKIMMFMPVMMTFFFLRMPSGLILYWVTNSLMSIIVQFILMKRHPQPAAA